VPHPDDIKIDMATGLVRITGPFTKEEKERWDLLRKRKEDAVKAIKEYEKDLLDPKKTRFKKFIEDEIQFEKQIIETISKVIKD
jgi:hypothetical protein